MGSVAIMAWQGMPSPTATPTATLITSTRKLERLLCVLLQR
jgi:hypothetical protein